MTNKNLDLTGADFLKNAANFVRNVKDHGLSPMQMAAILQRGVTYETEFDILPQGHEAFDEIHDLVRFWFFATYQQTPPQISDWIYDLAVRLTEGKIDEELAMTEILQCIREWRLHYLDHYEGVTSAERNNAYLAEVEALFVEIKEFWGN